MGCHDSARPYEADRLRHQRGRVDVGRRLSRRALAGIRSSRTRVSSSHRGGKAECLTQESGIALNYHPHFSPDGKWIAFVSDRKGQDNLWVMEADGSNPRPGFIDDEVRISQPAWTPDAESIVIRR